MRPLSISEKHQKNIAIKTLKMNDTFARIMGGMNKDEAREFLKSIGYTESQVRKLEARRVDARNVIASELVKIAKELMNKKDEAQELVKLARELISDGPIFNAEDKDELLRKVKSEIKAPVVGAQISTLGGADRATIMLVVSLDPKDEWSNGILENSRYFRMSLERDGKLKLFSGGHGMKTFRRRRVKSVDDAIKAINQYIQQEK